MAFTAHSARAMTSPRSRRRLPRLRAFVPAAGIYLTHLTCATAAHAQAASGAAGTDWTWSTLRQTPGVDTARVTWLERHVNISDAHALFAIISQLSKPEVAQLIVERMYGDGSVGADRALADSLYTRPSSGIAGAVDVAYLTTRLRETVLARARAGGAFATEFSGERLTVPTISSATRTKRAPRLTLRFDFAPAETFFAIVSTPNITADAATKRISTPLFDPLIRHRSQPFYPMPWSRELLGANLARAASTDPIDRLYIYAQPRGLLQYGDVSLHRERYRAVLRALQQNEHAILAYVADTLTPYVPEGFTIDRAVSIYFAGGADGWASSGATAFDLEYFKDDYQRLLNVIVHETYHGAQSAVAAASSPRARLVTVRDSALAQAATTIFLEGTANYIAPAKQRTPAEVLSAAREGEQLVSRVYAATGGTVDRDAMRQALNAGVAGGGPFYWLGAMMSKAIVDAFGRETLANTLRGSGADFVAEYVRATRALPSAPRFFSPEITAAILRLRN